MNILITGGMGFIGTNLAKSVISTGNHKIRIFDNLSPQIHGVLPGFDKNLLGLQNLEIVRGDVCSQSAISAALVGIDAIVHLAAETGTAQSMYQIAHYNAVNSQATAQMLDFLANNPHNVKKIVLASSRSIYGEGAYECKVDGVVYPGARTSAMLKNQQWDPVCPHCGSKIVAIPTPEAARPSPASIYAATKYAQEDLIRIAGDSLGIGTAILRFQNVYGAGQSLNNPYTGILSIFSTRIRRQMSLPIFEDGLESRDFVHVSDIVNAIQLALENDSSNGHTFNVGAGEPTSVLAIANMLVDAFGGKVRPEVTGQYRLGDIRHCYADLTQIRSTLNFEPKMSLTNGIEEFASWVMSQPLPEDGLDKANEELEEAQDDVMSLKAILFADLGRQYVIGGQPQRQTTISGLLISSFSPRFMPVVLFRLSHWFFQRKLFPLAKIFGLVNFVLFGLEIAARCEIGPGLYFPHTQGTVIGANKIGENATIYHNVTFGAREIDLDYSAASRPNVGDNVIVGAGAKVLGPVIIGNNARVGANAVVVEDVPAGATVVGIPARIVKQV